MKNRVFYFGTMVWHEIGHKINTRPLSHLLNDHVDLAHYGDDLQSIHFTFMAVEPHIRRGYADSFRYTKAGQNLSVYKRMDFNYIDQASETEALRYLGECFLETMQKLRQRKLANFDTETFLADLKQLLEKEYLADLVA